jgi:hypothetical protein
VAACTRVDDGAVRVTTQTTVNRKGFGVEGNLKGMVVDSAAVSADLPFRLFRQQPRR